MEHLTLFPADNKYLFTSESVLFWIRGVDTKLGTTEYAFMVHETKCYSLSRIMGPSKASKEKEY